MADVTPAFRVEMSDFENVWKVIQNTILHPFENTLYHVVPLLGAFTWGYTQIAPDDYCQNSMIPKRSAQKFFDEVETLRKCANLSKEIHLYTSLVFHFTSFGGRISATKPILVIPYHRLFRPDGSSFCGQPSLANNIHALTDDETRFFIAREISHIKFSDGVLKTAGRVMFIGALCLLYALPLSWPGIIASAITTLGLYLLADRIHEYSIDLFAVETLGRALNDPKRAMCAALSALEKQTQENRERRLQNGFCRFYLTESGNNLLDLKNPSLTSRIAALQLKAPTLSLLST